MGWEETTIFSSDTDNIEIIKREVFHNKTEFSGYRIHGFAKHGNTVFCLGEDIDIDTKESKKYWVVAFLTKRYKRNNVYHFLWKDIDAVRNLCFGFPRKWCKYLDKSDTSNAAYLCARNFHEKKQKEIKDIAHGSVYECSSDVKIEYCDGYEITPHEDFFIYVDKHYHGNLTRYRLAEKSSDNGYVPTFRTISKNMFAKFARRKVA